MHMRNSHGLVLRQEPALKTVVALLVVASFAIAGCAGDSAPTSEGGEAGQVAEAGAAPPIPIDRSIYDHPSRSQEDRDQDAGRMALEIYEWLGIQPGMTVADVYPAGGYNSHLLSLVVGDSGKVHSVFEFYAEKDLFEGRVYRVPQVQERIEQAGITNVELTLALDDVPSETIDVAIAVRNYHDVEWVFEGYSRADTVANFFRMVKPGGVVGIVEAATDREGWDQETHRLNEAVVIEDFTSAGFELVDSSDLLRNPADDHSASGFDEGRHTVDRYLLKFRRPAG
jgi:predicted methyltransferase